MTASKASAFVTFGMLVAAQGLTAHAQQAPQSAATDAAPTVTLLPHSETTWWWLSGQVNFIGQANGSFTSPYSGPHSFRAVPDKALSRVTTLYTGARLPEGWQLIFDVESSGGQGLSDAFGLAGYTNLDVVRNPTLGAAPYIARAMVGKVIARSTDYVDVTPTALALAPRLPTRRVEIWGGKMSLVDFFDVNAAASDSHLQFTNWTVDNTGSYDYAAETRGYTYALVVEYISPRWSLRGAAALMPKVANGRALEWNLTKARSENLEMQFLPTANLDIRMLAYLNHANMGSYTEAIDAFLAGETPTPMIDAHRQQTRIKPGVGGNVRYDVTSNVRLFARTGWNGGDSESFAYTEVNNTLVLGADIKGTRWQRPDDRAGVAFVSNGLSEPHRGYLRLGGLGFLLGDGTLRYGREEIVEGYYTAHLWRGIFVSAGAQFVTNPGYNRDRGPVFVRAARLHLDF
jgi:hypothetical protein